jgi:hypothetical protein
VAVVVAVVQLMVAMGAVQDVSDDGVQSQSIFQSQPAQHWPPTSPGADATALLGEPPSQQVRLDGWESHLQPAPACLVCMEGVLVVWLACCVHVITRAS